MTEITSEITPEVLIFYYNLIDDVLWEFSSKEVREDVKELYGEIKKLADKGYHCILIDDLSNAAIYLEGAKDCFNTLQETHGSPNNIAKKVLK